MYESGRHENHPMFIVYHLLDVETDGLGPVASPQVWERPIFVYPGGCTQLHLGPQFGWPRLRGAAAVGLLAQMVLEAVIKRRAVDDI